MQTDVFVRRIRRITAGHLDEGRLQITRARVTTSIKSRKTREGDPDLLSGGLVVPSQ
jgi:hypothetical protein